MVGNVVERLVKAAVIPAQQGVGDKGVQLQPALAVEHVKLFCHTDGTAHLRAGRYALRFEHRQVGQSRKADEPRQADVQVAPGTAREEQQHAERQTSRYTRGSVSPYSFVRRRTPIQNSSCVGNDTRLKRSKNQSYMRFCNNGCNALTAIASSVNPNTR